jgi:hypothetical protein
MIPYVEALDSGSAHCRRTSNETDPGAPRRDRDSNDRAYAA